jgi:hypothetical protein
MTYDEIQIHTEENPVLYACAACVYKVIAKSHGKVFAEVTLENAKFASCYSNRGIYDWKLRIQKPSKEHFNVPVFKWAAMDRDGNWYCYAKKPKIHHAEWSDGGRIRFVDPPSVKFTGDWKDSLVEL